VGAKSPLSYAVGLGLKGKVTGGEIGRIIEFFRSHNAVPRVNVCNLADESLLTELRACGFRLYEFINVLSRDLTLPVEEDERSSGVVVRLAKSDEAESWSKLVAEGFLDGAPYTEVERQLGLIFFNRATVRCYFAELNGKNVGAGALFTDGNYAALTAMSVMKGYRNRGVQGAAIRARLLEAQRLGCEIAGLFASPGSTSERNAERNGFRLIYTKAIMKLGA
jgi:GNAT superfamily N-acetyltransferase